VKAGRGIRVIAGSARGRRLVTPAGERVRPTKDIVREAMFSALEARGRISGAVVLDLYAGSGALAIEALSRGAARAVLVERDRSALHAIGENLRALALDDRARVAPADVARFLAGMPPAEAPFGLVVADPPYDTPGERVTALFGALSAPGWLTADALVCVERPVSRPAVPPEGWRTGWERSFGDTLVSFHWR
jgi:16S rRNA (guanine966-N2)-methyltransferase